MSEIMTPRKTGRSKGTGYYRVPKGFNRTDYSEKEKSQGVMVNFRISADNHLLIRKEAAAANVTVTSLLNSVLSIAFKRKGWRS